MKTVMKTVKLTDDDGVILLTADFNEKTVRTDCGDFYYDYNISFDDFIKFAHFIEKEEKEERQRNE